MQVTSRVTSKRQITIPAKVFSALNLQMGDDLLVDVIHDALVLRKSSSVLDALAGSVTVPDEYTKKSLDEIIEDAKTAYFSAHT